MNRLRKIWAGWWRVGAMVTATALAPIPAMAQFCSNCITNSAAAQVAQFNVSSGTFRGPVTVLGPLLLYGGFSVPGTSVTANAFFGDGSHLTDVDLALSKGVLPGASLSGVYSGVTGVGVLASGTWGGNVISSRFGGTGSNLSTAAQGSIPYFVATASMGALAPGTAGAVLQTMGAGQNPVWALAPAIAGTNVTSIPPANLAAGTLPSNVAVTDSSIGTVSASKVNGNISGGAASLTVALPIANLASGTLPTTNACSSVTAVSGLQPGTFGGPTTLAQFRVGYDGRISTAAQFNLVIPSTSIAPGPLPAGVTIRASQISSGTLAGDVVASSIAATAVAAGTYGSAARSLTATVQGDGRLTSLASQLIALPLSQLNSGNLPSGVHVPAANVNAGSLSASVMASSFPVTGVTAGPYGDATHTPRLTVDAQGRVTAATQFAIPGVSTSTALTNADNAWSHSQTSLAGSSWTLHDNLSANNVTALFFFGDGSGLTGVSVSGLAGPLPAAVTITTTQVYGFEDRMAQIASSTNTLQTNITTLGTSVAAATTTIASNLATETATTSAALTSLAASTTSLTAGKLNLSGGTMTGALNLTNVAVNLNGANGNVVSAASVTASAFYGDGSHLSGITSSKSGFLSASNATLGVGTFSFGWTNAAVTISSMSVIVTAQGSGGTTGTVWSCCYGGSCVDVTSTAGAAVGSSFTGHGSVAVAAGGQMVLEMKSSDESVTPTVNGICGYQ